MGLKKNNPGCGCCGTACDACQAGTSPPIMQVSMLGWQDDACDDCDPTLTTPISVNRTSDYCIYGPTLFNLNCTSGVQALALHLTYSETATHYVRNVFLEDVITGLGIHWIGTYGKFTRMNCAEPKLLFYDAGTSDASVIPCKNMPDPIGIAPPPP